MITVEEIAQITGNPDWSHRSSDSEISLLVYYSCEYPIHHSCLDVFTRALRIAKGRVSTDESVALDIKPLVLAFTSLKPSGFFMTHLEVDFFEIQGTQGQQWEVEHGHEVRLLGLWRSQSLSQLLTEVALRDGSPWYTEPRRLSKTIHAGKGSATAARSADICWG
jgi:hypothetical protein